MLKNLTEIAIFIDDGNMWSVYKSMGKLIDYSKLEDFFAKKFNGKVTKVFFYKAYPKNKTRKYSLDPQHKFMTYLNKELSFVVRKKELKTILLRAKDGSLIYDQKSGKPANIEKGNFDVEITIDMLREISNYNIAILLSGDSDFLPIIKLLKNIYHKKVYIFSTASSVSSELRTGADGYFDLAKFPEIHGSKLRFRKTQMK